jgi:hypothetical protein
MMIPPMFSLLSSCALSLAVAAQDGKPVAPPPPAAKQATVTLDELIAKSSELKSFVASYTLTTSKPEDQATLIVQYRAPDRVRIDRILKSGGGSSMWCVGGVATLQAHGPNAMHGSVDYAPIIASMRPIQEVLQKGYPAASALTSRPGAYVNVRWWFDEKAGKANYLVEAQWTQNRSTGFGWLETLRQKHVAPTDDGENLVFDTDNAFHILIAKKNGFLQQLDGKSPGGEMHLTLATVDTEQAPDDSIFKVQEGVTDGFEISDDMRRNVTQGVLSSMRDGVYSTIASEAAGPAWDEATKAKIGGVCRALHERSLEVRLESWCQNARRKRDAVAERLTKLAADGKTPAEVAAEREKELGFLTKALDEVRTAFTAGLSVPVLATPLPRGAELLALESAAVGATFDATVRAPLIAEFEKATAPKSK